MSPRSETQSPRSEEQHRPHIPPCGSHGKYCTANFSQFTKHWVTTNWRVTTHSSRITGLSKYSYLFFKINSSFITKLFLVSCICNNYPRIRGLAASHSSHNPNLACHKHTIKDHLDHSQSQDYALSESKLSRFSIDCKIFC